MQTPISIKTIPKNLKIIVINGQGRNGKDTFVNFCKEYHSNVYNYSTIDTFRDTLKNFVDTEEKTNEYRKLLSDYKKLINSYTDFTKREIIDKVSTEESLAQRNPNMQIVLFIHSREPKEIEWIVDKFDGISLLINKSVSSFGNESDDNVFNYNYDYIINNNGTLEELKTKSKDFIDMIFPKEIQGNNIYKQEKFLYNGFTYYPNPKWRKNND